MVVCLECNENLSRVHNRHLMARHGIDLVEYHRRYPSTAANYHCKWVQDDNYFEQIDTEEKAYFLGLIITDGNVYHNTMTLCLQGQDRYMLELFRDAIGSDKPIEQGHGNNNYIFRVSSRKMVSDLGRWGVVPRKSLVATPPVLDSGFDKHFWRGAMDGNGCLFSGYHSRGLYLAGSDRMVAGFYDFCLSIGDTQPRVTSDRSIWRCVVQHQDAIPVITRLYEDAHIYLARKFSTANTIIEFYQNKRYRSQFKGVSRSNVSKLWRSACRVNGVDHCFGYFESEEQAAMMYDQYVREHALNRTVNFPVGSEIGCKRKQV